MSNIILAIETSCDETAASVFGDGCEVLSSVVSSQIDVHKKFGGVVPELASRKHVESIMIIINDAIESAGIIPSDLNAVAVTNGPGLIGCLLVGLSAAKAMAFSLGVPLIAVDHIEAHAFSASLEYDIEFPYVSLVVSGGHTSLFKVNSYKNLEVLGKTRDDAAGEAFDKAAKAMGLSYPGGIQIDRLSKKGNREKYKFPRPFLNSDSLDFSFSGIKTSLVNFLNKYKINDQEQLNNVCASYQEAIVETLIEKTINAARINNIDHVSIAGGVASNSRLREYAAERFLAENLKLYIPSAKYCTDNAAMIAALGYQKYINDEISDMDLEVYSTKRTKYIRGKGYNKN